MKNEPLSSETASPEHRQRSKRSPASKPAWSKPRVRLVTLTEVHGGTLPGVRFEHGGYNPSLSS